MSIQSINWSLSANVGNPGQKLVLIILANYADEKGEAWPSQKTIAIQACMTDRAVRSNLAKLESAGLISRTHRYRKDGTFASDAYCLNLGRAPINEAKPAEETSYGPAEETSCGIQRKNIPVPAEESSYHDPSLEPISPSTHARAKKSPKPQKPDSTIDLPDWLPTDSWDEFQEHRRDMKKPLSALAARKMLNRLEGLRNKGHDPVKLIDMAIASSWLNVYEREETRADGNDTGAGNVSSFSNHTAHGGNNETHKRRYQSVVSRQAELAAERERERQRRRSADTAPAEETGQVIEGVFQRLRGAGNG